MQYKNLVLYISTGHTNCRMFTEIPVDASPVVAITN